MTKPSIPRLENTRGVLRGAWAEEHAAKHLEAAGLKILQRNYRIRGGEIDLIAIDPNQTTIFIEVKQRTSSSHGTAGESINLRKAGLIRRAALHYLGRDDLPCRFDAVLIEGANPEQCRITWIQDAF
jgi:putative endonuclease